MSPKPNRKLQLVQIATQLFKEKGYTASSMRDLAQKVGIEAASLYSHIKSKEEILQHICFGMAEAFFNAVNKIDEENIQSMPLKLEKYIIAHVKVITSDTDAAQVFTNEWKHLSEPQLSLFIEKRVEYENRFSSIILQGIQNGDFRETDVKITVLTILSSLNWIPNWYSPSGILNPEKIGNLISSVLIEGLKK